MSRLFSFCSSLESIPNIFKFKGEDIEIGNILENFNSLISLPDIKDKSKYRTQNYVLKKIICSVIVFLY